MDKYKSRYFIAVVMSALLWILSQCSYAVTIDKIVTFGDSLSDNGNIYTFTRAAHKVLPVVPIIPQNPPYHEGRFSNGNVWVELLAHAMDVRLVDHAYGGSWIESVWDSSQIVPFSLSQQVNFYLVENVLDFHKDRHLFVIWSGANDYLQGREDIEYATDNSVKELKKNMESLIYHNARTLLVLTLPDLSQLPEIMQKGPDAVLTAKKLSETHNRKLLAMIDDLRKKNDKAKIVVVDIMPYFRDAILHPENFRLKNVKDACFGGGYYLDPKLMNMQEVKAAKDINLDLMTNVSLRTAYMNAKLALLGNNVCEAPDEYMFWDQVHPTRIIHQVIAILALTVLNENDVYGPDSKGIV
jgi:phospholipase/lecithinase/hemolysin